MFAYVKESINPYYSTHVMTRKHIFKMYLGPRFIKQVFLSKPTSPKKNI